jgi:diguanylate cyclase (GGDEF)-like protein/PAS domain S-box-containing protein
VVRAPPRFKGVSTGADEAKVEGGRRSGDGAPGPEPLGRRLRRRAFDPAIVLANPTVAAAFCLLRWRHLIAPLPYWLLVTVVFAGGTLAVGSAAVLGDDRRGWHMPAYLAVNMGVITVVAYSTGWGPILSVGFLFGSGTAFQLFGSRVVRWAVGCTVVWMALGQLAIALGVAPTLIRQPLVHGLAALSLLGTVLTMSLLGRVTGAREEAETVVRQSERRFKALVSNAADIIIVVDADGVLQYVSPAFERILGISASPYFEISASGVIHPDDLDKINSEFSRLADDPDQVLRTHLRIRAAGGHWRHFEATVTNRMADPDVGGIVGNLHDITELLDANERFRSAFEDAPIGIALASLDGDILRANRAFGAIVGHAPEDLVGRTVDSLSHPEDTLVGLNERRSVTTGSSEGYELEKRLVHADGRPVWVHVHVSGVRDSDGHPLYLIAQVQDVTEQRLMRERLAHAAIHDPLTGLPNRVLFLDRLTMALSRAARHGRRVAVAFLDVDRFKLVNDGLGHAAGDELLRAVAERLVEAVRDEDTVARFGGDEFTILWETLEDDDEAVAVARRLLDVLRRPFELDGSPVYVTASIGVAVTDGHTPAATVLRDADTAMYTAKDAGRSRVEVFEGRAHSVVLENLRVINELHHALAHGEFRVHYQPIVDLVSGEPVGVEALVRWQHPTRGLLEPEQFIGAAEECGLVVPMGAWVLQEACRQVALWNRAAAAAGKRPTEVNVNISPRQLASSEFVDAVRHTIAATGIDPSSLCLEITESTLMHDERAAAEVLGQLRRLGVRLCIDDFGTGYSSLSYLMHFPLDSLKVDRAFVDGLGEESDESVIVGAIVALAHSLGLMAVAEGVETPLALTELVRLGCDRVQGYLLGHPVPPDDLEAVLIEAGSGLFDLGGRCRRS